MEKKIGFIGCYSHDIILLLAKAFSYMEKRVLVEDRNKKHTLSASVPLPERLSSTQAVVEYDGVYFARNRKEKEEEKTYDVILCDFGMDADYGETEECSYLVLVTDLLPHHIRELKCAEIPVDKVRVCIVRDALRRFYGMEIKEFWSRFPNRTELFLPPDLQDIKNRYVCEVQHEYFIGSASEEMQNTIFCMAELFCPEYTEKELRRKRRVRERRRYG